MLLVHKWEERALTQNFIVICTLTQYLLHNDSFLYRFKNEDEQIASTLYKKESQQQETVQDMLNEVRLSGIYDKFEKWSRGRLFTCAQGL